MELLRKGGKGFADCSQLACGAGFARGIFSKLAASRAGGQELVHHNAQPLDARGSEQGIASRTIGFGRIDGVEDRVPKAGIVLEWDRNFRLAEEVADQFCGIVSSGIFEVNERGATCIIDKAIVEAKI